MKHEVIFEKGYRRLRSTLYRRCHYLAVSACTFTAVLRSTQPSTLRWTVKLVSAYGLSNNNNGDGGCGWQLPIFGGFSPSRLAWSEHTGKHRSVPRIHRYLVLPSPFSVLYILCENFVYVFFASESVILWFAYLVLWYQYCCGFSTNICSLLYWSSGIRGRVKAYQRLRMLAAMLQWKQWVNCYVNDELVTCNL